MKNHVIILSILLIMLTQCKNKEMQSTNKESFNKDQVAQVINDLKNTFGEEHAFRIERGVNQVAALWVKADGDFNEYTSFCKENFFADNKDLETLFTKLSRNFEVIWGNFLKMEVELKEPLHLDKGEVDGVDMKFGGFKPGSHLNEDFYQNKIAFLVALNFPFYTLKEKEEKGEKWSRKEWAYARMGDLFISRVPSELIQKASEISTNSDAYISDYNIFLGKLIDDDGNTLFPLELKLISHWGLRDELKSNYADENGLVKQKMIYEVMKRIIDQSIPKEMINSDVYQWDPYKNLLFKDGNEVSANPETEIRYQHLLNNFKALHEMDEFNPHYPTYIQRKFDGGMEISQEDVENLFIAFVTSSQVNQVAELISNRLGRDLEPFDIWYDGFKGRSSMNEEELDKVVRAKYPNPAAFEADMDNILLDLGFTAEQAGYIQSKVQVDPARGSGHAWGAAMRSENARLRTRIPENGMNYKGFNIAIHEFGHNVEQTITLQNVDYYILNGVPNTAFTEALAFIFQKRDLELLGLTEENKDKIHFKALDNFWSCYEIMGVSLVDMNVWKWLYKNPDATDIELKDAVITIAKDVWNTYYADVFGSRDETILAIYSHMIDYPLYLSAYPIGQIIDFQIEGQLAERDFAAEIYRMYTQGSIIPQLWMKNAVGKEISISPLLKATEKAIKNFQNDI
ncbi:hypothetical protein ACFLRZ_02050 [Bacteroidota bacterium]